MNKLYAIGAAFLAGIAAIFMAFRKGSESATNKIEAQSEKKARKVEKKASKAMLDGMEKENKNAQDNKPSDRGRFTK